MVLCKGGLSVQKKKLIDCLLTYFRENPRRPSTIDDEKLTSYRANLKDFGKKKKELSNMDGKNFYVGIEIF